MFGFSISKIVVLALILLLVWYGFKLFGRRSNNEKISTKEQKSSDTIKQNLDMIMCSSCGNYVPVGTLSCEQKDCPFPNE